MEDKKRIEILKISCIPEIFSTPVLMISIENEKNSDIGYIRILPSNIYMYRIIDGDVQVFHSGSIDISSFLLKNKTFFFDHVRGQLKSMISTIPGYYIQIQNPRMMEQFLHIFWAYSTILFNTEDITDMDKYLMKILPISLVSNSEFISKLNKVFTN